ncbi:MAG: hypothetical protein NTY80_02260 [candidate division SR1 bacterium]|nr:hypothetical protein [candidate division SR1 bacterium]
MTKNTKYPDLTRMKNELKSRAASLREQKKRIKNNQKELSAIHKNKLSSSEEELILHGNCARFSEVYEISRNVYRHLYVAYCELRGKSRGQIEKTSSRKIDEKLITRHKLRYAPLASGSSTQAKLPL